MPGRLNTGMLEHACDVKIVLSPPLRAPIRNTIQLVAAVTSWPKNVSV